MKLGSMDPALACSGPMSTFSYDSHPISRGMMGHLVDELPRVYKAETKTDTDYDLREMDIEIQRVARELYRAFNGMNEGFKEPTDQIVIDELSSHTDSTRQQLIHPYKTIYGRNLNNVLKANLGDIWSSACSSLMCEMRMYELECLRRRMEDEGDGIERLLVKGKKDQLEEVDGDPYKYFLLAGTSHPYPDDTFYSVGRVPRKLLMKYLGIKMYLVRLRCPPAPAEWLGCREQADLAMACAGIISPANRRRVHSPPRT